MIRALGARQRHLPIQGSGIDRQQVSTAGGDDRYPATGSLPCDGCVRRELVMDIDHPSRGGRKVGWHRCMNCVHPFFSKDGRCPSVCGEVAQITTKFRSSGLGR